MKPYSQNVVAPDHLLTRAGKRIIEVCFLQLNFVTIQESHDTVFRFALKRLGVCYQSSIFNMTSKRINNVTMSSIFPYLPLMLSLVDSLRYFLDFEIHPILKLFSELVALTCWWPTVQSDGSDAVENIHRVRKNSYYIDLQNFSTNFFKQVSKLCDTCPHAQDSLKRPNQIYITTWVSICIPYHSTSVLFTSLI